MLYLGIDGGGSKTEAVLCDEAGHILSRVRTGASAPSSVPEETLQKTLRQLYADLQLEGRGEIRAYAGVSGCGTPWDREIFLRCSQPLLPAVVHMDVGSDSVCALNAGIGPKTDGVLLISGTGSVAYLRSEGQYTRIGGWGYLAGDEGSGFDMGRRAICAALRAHDGRGPATLLTEMIQQHIGQPVDHVTISVYEKGRTEVASYAKLLVKAAEAGDAVALEQLDACVEELLLHVRTAVQKSGRENLPLVLAGGLLRNSTFLLERLRKGIGSVQLALPKEEPVYGAVLEARGFLDSLFEQNYHQDWKVLQK